MSRTPINFERKIDTCWDGVQNIYIIDKNKKSFYKLHLFNIFLYMGNNHSHTLLIYIYWTDIYLLWTNFDRSYKPMNVKGR